MPVARGEQKAAPLPAAPLLAALSREALELLGIYLRVGIGLAALRQVWSAAASPLSGSVDRIAVQRSAAPRRVPERVGPAPAGSRGFAGSRARWQHCCGRETARAAARQGASVARAAARSALPPGAVDCRGGCDRTGKA